MKRRISCILVALTLVTFISCSKKNVAETNFKRIVSLGPSATEILFAIGAGDKIVARTDFCDYPEQVSDIPSVGGFDSTNISLESIISFEPDLVYLFAGMHDNLIKPLEELGIKVFVSDASSIKAIEKEILDAGKLINRQEEAVNVVAEMDAKLSEVRNFAAESRKEGEYPSVFWQVWDEPLMSVGKQSFINDMISAAGGKNIFEDIDAAYPIVSEEAVIAANPKYIFITGNADNRSKILFNAMKKDSGATVCYVDSDKFSRPSPRCVDAVEEISKKIYGKTK